MNRFRNLIVQFSQLSHSDWMAGLLLLQFEGWMDGWSVRRGGDEWNKTHSI